MSSEFESEIKESVAKEKFILLIKKSKYYLIFFFALILILPILYQLKVSFDKKVYQEQLENYSIALNNLNSKNDKAGVEILKKLINSDNSFISLLSINQLILNNILSKEEKINLIDHVLNNKKLSSEHEHILKIKKSLIIFNEASENEILFLRELNNDKLSLNKLSSTILSDFYKSKESLKKIDVNKKLN